jgi:hypothetical protein
VIRIEGFHGTWHKGACDGVSKHLKPNKCFEAGMFVGHRGTVRSKAWNSPAPPTPDSNGVPTSSRGGGRADLRTEEGQLVLYSEALLRSASCPSAQ